MICILFLDFARFDIDFTRIFILHEKHSRNARGMIILRRTGSHA